MERFVYADNAATTPVSQKVLDAMIPFFCEKFGNPSSLYSVGREAQKAVELAREQVARCLNAQPNEIFFTSGGSEADNWAIKGVAYEQAKRGKKHIITSRFEHHAVLHTVEALSLIHIFCQLMGEQVIPGIPVRNIHQFPLFSSSLHIGQ